MGNSAGLNGGAIYIANGDQTLVSSTLSENIAGDMGGGVFAIAGNSHSISLHNSMVANNGTNGLFDIEVFTGSPINVDANYSLIGAADGLPIVGMGNLTGTAAGPLDPQLAPLADNGGPTNAVWALTE